MSDNLPSLYFLILKAAICGKQGPFESPSIGGALTAYIKQSIAQQPPLPAPPHFPALPDKTA